MSPEAQIYFNLAMGAFCGLGGWILNNLNASIKALHDNDAALGAKLQGIEVLVAGKYVTKDSIKDITTALFNKLDKIEAKLDQKVDRDACGIHHGGKP